MSLNPGTRLGRYEVRSKLGEGGMGEVYLAEDTQLRRPVALKLLPAEAAQQPESLRRFQQEARAASALSHPNIAHIYEIGEADGMNFIAMEYVEGQPLSARLNQRPLAAHEVARIGAQVADALDEAHQAGVTHRDIKAANIMLTARGRVKVLDFGLAKVAPQESESEAATRVKTKPGVVMGTVSYMSPEQAMGREVDARTDIWSLGVVLYEMTTGRLPFAGGSLTETIDAIAHSQPEAIARFNYDVPAELEVIIKKALRKRREERYQTAHDLLVDLQTLARELELAGEHSVAPDARTGAEQPRATFTGAPSTAAPAPRASVRETARPTVSSAEYVAGRIRDHKRGAALALALIVAALAATGFGLYKFLGRERAAPSGAPLKVTPLTSSPGVERNVAFSPDGKQIAYVWTGEQNDNFDIYVKIIGAGEPLRLTASREREMSPAWSPDGRYVAFLRGTGESKGFYLIAALGGAERKLADAYGWAGAGVMPQALAFSPGGHTLAVVDKTAEDEPWSIFLVSVETGERHRLTAPPAGYDGDRFVAFSPDGSRLAFARRHTGEADIYTVAVAGGEPVRLTSDEAVIAGLAWTPDDTGLIFSSDRGGGDLSLWRVPAAGGAPTPVAGVGENATDLSISRQGDRLAYAQLSTDLNIYRLELTTQAGGRRAAGAPASFISSTRIDQSAQFSPDGRRVAFMSNRSGSDEIWICDSEGRNAAQLTNFGLHGAATPSWSPDARLIAFASLAGGNPDIYVVGAEGGSPRRLTTDLSAELTPSWSRDGRWIYFASNRTGRGEVWKMPAAGGAAAQLTRGGGRNPVESPDGRTVYYLRGRDEPGLWQVSTEGGEETQVFEARVDLGNWAAVGRGIYFLTRQPQTSLYTLEFYDFTTRQTTQMTTLEGPRGTFVISSLTVSPDERWMLFARRDKLDFDLMLVENFR